MPKTQAETATSTFISKRSRLRVVLTPDWDEFHTGGIVTRHKGRTVEFIDNRLTTDDPALAEKLRAHDEFGDAFVEMTTTPAPPDPGDVLQRIARLAAEADEENLRLIIADEEETHKREAVILTAGAALESVRSLKVGVGEPD